VAPIVAATQSVPFFIHKEHLMKNKLLVLVAAVPLVLPVAADATLFQFNAALSGANELPTASGSAATGVAALSYDDFGTALVTDDRYSFSMSVFGLSGAATAFHIHGAATTAENAPVRVNLDDTTVFANSTVGGTLLVGAANVTPPATIPATPAGTFLGQSNAGHPEMAFLQMLQSGFAYVNVHTAAFPGGEIRGQFLEVTPVPEPETYALMLAGLGLVGWAVRRRTRSIPV